MKTKGPKQDN